MIRMLTNQLTNMGIVGEEMGNFQRDMETLKKNQMEILELKNTISEIENSLSGN